MTVWNAGAHLTQPIGTGDFRLSATIQTAVGGAAVGFTQVTSVTRPADFTYGILVTNGTYSVIEGGQVVTGASTPPGATCRYHATFTDGEIIYSIQEEGDESFTAQAAGPAIPGTIFHTSTAPSLDGYEAAVTLLNPADAVINTGITQVAYAENTVAVSAPMGANASAVDDAVVYAVAAPLAVRGGQYTTGTVDIAFPSMRTDGRITRSGAEALAAFLPAQVTAGTGVMAGAQNTAAMAFPLMLMQAYGGPYIEPSASLTFAPMQVGAYQNDVSVVEAVMGRPAVFASGRMVPKQIEFYIELPTLTHEVDLASYVLERAFADDTAVSLTAMLVVESGIANSELLLTHSDRQGDVGIARDMVRHGTVAVIEASGQATDEIVASSLAAGVVEIGAGSAELSMMAFTTTLTEERGIGTDTAEDFAYDAVIADAQAYDLVTSVGVHAVESAAQAESAIEMVKLDDGTLIEASALGFTDLEHWRQSAMLVGEFADAFSEYQHKGTDLSATALVMNAETAAAYTYTNFPLTAGAQADGVVYAVGPDGFYRIEGDTDDGLPIGATIEFGAVSLGQLDRNGLPTQAAQRKRVSSIWFDAEAPLGFDVKLRSLDQNQSYTYSAESSANFYGNLRVRVGGGLKSRYWGVQITNTYGGDFELNGINADVMATGRR